MLEPSSTSTALDPTEAVELLLRDLKTARDGLTSREAQRRLVQFGPNELRRRGGRRWPRELARQFTHPLALLLWLAAGLAWRRGTPVALAIVVVIVLNAVFAFVQEMQAERAVEALRELPASARHGGPRRQLGDRWRASSCPATCCSSRRASASPPTRGCSSGGIEIDRRR